MFIYAAFKSHMVGNNAQRVITPTAMILPTTVCTSHSLNCFGHMIYMQQINMYLNIAKHLTQQKYI